MTRKQLVTRAKKIVKKMAELRAQIDNLQDDMQIEADGCTEKQKKQQQDFQSMSNQTELCKESLEEAITDLSWIS